MIFQLQEINTASCCAVHLYNHTARENEIVEKVCNYNSLYFNNLLNISMKYCMFLYKIVSMVAIYDISKSVRFLSTIVLFTVPEFHSSETAIKAH